MCWVREEGNTDMEKMWKREEEWWKRKDDHDYELTEEQERCRLEKRSEKNEEKFELRAGYWNR